MTQPLPGTHRTEEDRPLWDADIGWLLMPEEDRGYSHTDARSWYECGNLTVWSNPHYKCCSALNRGAVSGEIDG
jgi:hypothetical protein